ncbi:MAG: hypothetical protein ACI8QH_000744 [Flammeovirgaceae bacterium]|jgi:hypothetical protein
MKSILSVSLLFFLVLGANAQINEQIKRSFETANSPELSIKNSFGDISIKKHKKNFIDVLVEINVVPQKSKDYEKVKGKVWVDIQEVGDRLELTTINELDGVSTEKLEIDYTIYIPENTSLKIRNQFGDVWIEGTESNVYARVQHGDFFCGDIGGKNNSIKVQFGELRLESIKDAELEIHHGDFRAYRLMDVELEVQFSDAEIDHVEGDVVIDMQHSDLSIDIVGIGLSKLDIEAQFSDVEIESGMWSIFYMELEGSFTDFSLPSLVKGWIVYESDAINSVEYVIGESETTSGKIMIDANHSDVDLE